MIAPVLRALDAPRWPVARVETPSGVLLPGGVLDLSCVALSRDDARALGPALAAHPHVVTLNLAGASLTDDALAELFARDLSGSRIARLHLGANPYSAEASAWLLPRLASLPSLRTLLLKRTAFDARAAASLPSLPSLRALDLAACRLSPEALLAVATALPDTALECLFLSAQRVPREALDALARALPSSRLTSLSLCHTGLSSAALSRLCEALARTPTLTTLDLASNGLSPAAAAPLAALLAQDPPLRELRLGDVGWSSNTDAPANALQDDGAAAITDALRHNTQLTHLDLAHNHLSIDALRALLGALVTHPRMSTVHLGQTLPQELTFQLVALSCRAATRAQTPPWRLDLDALRPASMPARQRREGFLAGGLSALPDDRLYELDLRPRPAEAAPAPVRDALPHEDLATTARVLRALLERPNDPAHADLRALCTEVSRRTHAPAPRAESSPARAMVASSTRRRPLESLPPTEPSLEDADRAHGAPRNCYVCKAPYTEHHPAYPRLCHRCGALSFVKRHQSADLSGRVWLVTGARVKVGFQIVLKLLRAGATVIATSRFPRDAARRFAAEADFDHFRARLTLERLDLRFIPEVERFAEHLAATLPRLDGIVHNAAQTVRRVDRHWGHLNALEAVAREHLPEAIAALCPEDFTQPAVTVEPAALAHVTGDLLRVPPEPVDTRARHSWVYRIDEVSAQELTEAVAVNALAPYVLTARLRAHMAASGEGPRFVVNVSAVEGQFYRTAKTAAHPHTNMAKAALNMLTRTAAQDLAADRIYMNAVDTGWFSNENPLPVVERMADAGFVSPLDAVDAAARVLDPVFTGLSTGECVWGLFLKDFRPAPW